MHAIIAATLAVGLAWAGRPPVSLHYNTSNTGFGQRNGLSQSSTRWVKWLGRTASIEGCSELCVAYAPERCRSFSRYSARYVKNESEVGNCYGHVDPAWLPLHSSDGVDSGLVQWPCENDADCSLNGECAKQQGGGTVCHCSTGWHGDRCELLKLAPVDRSVLGFNPHNASSWGGSIQQVGGKWHMWVSLFDHHCTVSTYLLNSRVVHAVSTTDSVLGPYKEKESVVPPFAHEPDVARAPTGELVMITVHGDLGMLKNGSLISPPYKPCECTVAGVPKGPCPGGCNSCHIQSPTLSVASTPDGPWITTPIWPGGGENPSIWITKDGSVLGMSRGGKMSAYSAHWANISGWTHTMPGGDATPSFMSSRPDIEDPFLYQDENDNWHALLHSLEGPHMVGGTKGALVGTHAFSVDGLKWMYTGLAYTNEVNLTDGTALQLNRRERPHLVFAEGTRTPVALTNSAESGHGSFTLVQAIGTSHDEIEDASDVTAVNLPAFSWETIPRFVHCGPKATAKANQTHWMPLEEVYEKMSHFPLATLEKFTLQDSEPMNLHEEAKILEAARAIRRFNTSTKIIFYHMAWQNFAQFDLYNTSIAHANDQWLVSYDNGSIPGLDVPGRPTYNLSNAGMRNAWVSSLQSALATKLIDGFFIDITPQALPNVSDAVDRNDGTVNYAKNVEAICKFCSDARRHNLLSGLTLALEELADACPNAIIICNPTDFGACNTQFFEFFGSSADHGRSVLGDFELLENKFNATGHIIEARAASQNASALFHIAEFLISAGRFTYLGISHSPGWGCADGWLDNGIPEDPQIYDRPLGAPLGPYTRTPNGAIPVPHKHKNGTGGWVYTRSFQKNTHVWLNLTDADGWSHAHACTRKKWPSKPTCPQLCIWWGDNHISKWPPGFGDKGECNRMKLLNVSS